MNIQFASDLHLEVPRNAHYFQRGRFTPLADVLILAGDTMCWNEDYLQNSFWDEISSIFAQVLVIPGNHEFYNGYDLSFMRQNVSGVIRDNIHWYYNQSIEIDGIQIILSTLWSQIPSNINERIQCHSNDFHCIHYKGSPITIYQYNKENNLCVNFITNELQKEYSKRIVISHHAPVLDVVCEPIQKSWYVALYANQLNKLIQENNINYWIYGHSHRAIGSYNLDGTTLVTNPCGYISKRENPLFNLNKIITI